MASSSRRSERASRCSRSNSRSSAAPGPTGPSRSHGEHYQLVALDALPKPRTASAPADHHRRGRKAPHRAHRGAVRRRVQHRLRDAGRVRRAARRVRAGLGGRRPRPRDAHLLGDAAVGGRRRRRPMALLGESGRRRHPPGLRRCGRALRAYREPAWIASCSSTCVTPTSRRSPRSRASRPRWLRTGFKSRVRGRGAQARADPGLEDPVGTLSRAGIRSREAPWLAR